MRAFYFGITKLLERVHTTALYLARNIKQDRTNDFYHLSIIDAEDFLKDKLRSISARIFADFFAPYARDLITPYLFDDYYGDLSGQIVFYAEFPADTFDDNLYASILQAVEDVMIDYVVYEWMYHSNYDYRKSEEIYLEGMRRISSLVNRRNATFTRTYKLF